MIKLTADVIPQLLDADSAPTVTLYMPTHQAHSPPNMSEDQVRFKNLHAKAMEIIRNVPEIDTETANAIDTRLEQLQEDLSFWETQGLGLAVFANPKSTTTVQLPLGSDEYVAVDERFHISPLLGLLYGMTEYYVLLISEKEPILFVGDMYDLRQAGVPLPASGHSGSQTLEEEKVAHHPSLKYPDSQPAYFGGNFPVTNDHERRQFFRSVDRTIREACGTTRPLLLAGAEADVAAFRSVSIYPHLLSACLPNSTTSSGTQQLFHDTLAIFREETRKRRDKIMARYEQLRGNGSGLASDNLPAIEDGANTGRIETLFMKMIRLTADTLSNSTTDVPKLVFLPDEQMATADYLAVQTWRNRGEVVPMEDSSTATTPTQTVLSAIFRY